MWIKLLGLLGKLLCGQTCSAYGQPDLACEKAFVAPFPIVAVGDPTGSQLCLFPGRCLCAVYRLYTQMPQGELVGQGESQSTAFWSFPPEALAPASPALLCEHGPLPHTCADIWGILGGCG